ncbi:MAG: 3-hydroxyacyl-CoA dehydrogenase family protein [Desulfobacterales bacterium]|nr:3-hydroxyacyl-CoA dehydrogenase family protein [Desulfobacterales bacterium]
MNEIGKVAVVGAGMMGAEIAYCFALAGKDVVLNDASMDLACSGKHRLEKILDKGISKGKIEPERKQSVLSLITPTDADHALGDADLVVEAVFEDEQVKKEVMSRLDTICQPHCIFATNTSSIPITRLATAVGPDRIGRFIGTHYFSPVSLMKLVEVVPGLETTEETVATMMACCRDIGKTPIRVKDVPGFAVNRILHAMWIEVNRLVEEEVATIEDIDIGCKLGLGHPIGPYALMDLTTNTLNLQVQQILFDAYGERFMPRPVLKQKVDANHLGRKTGRGWYDYRK